MNQLTGYARLNYSDDHMQCTVTIITKTAKELKLSYYFNGINQTSPIKVFDSSYTQPIKIKITAEEGPTLELDDIDFIWNVQKLGKRDCEECYKNGQKGAIVELFGWPDDDIAQECETIAKAGYLGIKIFPHQEQVMSYQPYENELNPWYFMYQPVSYRLQGRMGTRDQLKNMINTCRKHGLRVYGDAVINHMTANGNDLSNHRKSGDSCITWGNKTSSAEPSGSPYYTPAYTYETNQYTNRGTNVLEFPAVPYFPEDFHCDKSINSWSDPNMLNTGWVSDLADLDTSKEYVRQRIADFLIDMLSIGFSGFRIDSAKHIHPTDLAAIFAIVKDGMGGKLPDDFLSWLAVQAGDQSEFLVQGDGEYSYTGGLTKRLQENGFTDSEINMIKIWWSNYPNEPNIDNNSINKSRKVIQNDDHEQQFDDSSRNMNNKGCVLVTGCSPETHRDFEVKLFKDPYGVSDNDADYPIRLILSSYYFADNGSGKSFSPPDGKSDCSNCTTNCDECHSRSYSKAYKEDVIAYSGSDYTRVHRDQEIISAMREWMKLTK